MCVKYVVSSFLDHSWRLYFVDKNRQQNPLSLPFAHPQANAMTLVVDQELLLCRLHFKSTMSITQFSSLIGKNWHYIHPLLSHYLWAFFAFSKS